MLDLPCAERFARALAQVIHDGEAQLAASLAGYGRDGERRPLPAQAAWRDHGPVAAPVIGAAAEE